MDMLQDGTARSIADWFFRMDFADVPFCNILSNLFFGINLEHYIKRKNRKKPLGFSGLVCCMYVSLKNSVNGS